VVKQLGAGLVWAAMSGRMGQEDVNELRGMTLTLAAVVNSSQHCQELTQLIEVFDIETSEFGDKSS